MRAFLLFVIVVVMATSVLPQALPVPQVVTDPKQISSKPNAQVEKNLTIEKLYMTRAVGGTTWSPDGKTIAFISNMSGRNNLWLVAADGGWPSQLTISDQRQAHPTWSPDDSELVFADQPKAATTENAANPIYEYPFALYRYKLKLLGHRQPHEAVRRRGARAGRTVLRTPIL